MIQGGHLVSIVMVAFDLLTPAQSATVLRPHQLIRHVCLKSQQIVTVLGKSYGNTLEELMQG